jgi:hypothetical protein
MTNPFFIFISLSLIVKISFSEPIMLDTHFIKHVLEQFKIVNPILVSVNFTKTAEVKIIKLFSTNAQRTQIVNFETKTFLEHNGLCCKLLVVHDVTKINITHFLFGTTCPILIVLSSYSIIEAVLSSVQIQINQKVYFLSSSTNQVFEAYNINNIRIVRKLGMFESMKNTSKLTFNSEPGVKMDFIQRRSNFQGVTLKAMVEVEIGSLLLPPNFEAIGKYLFERTRRRKIAKQFSRRSGSEFIILRIPNTENGTFFGQKTVVNWWLKFELL